jgi:DNA-binding NarL/FixJ family response regulator
MKISQNTRKGRKDIHSNLLDRLRDLVREFLKNIKLLESGPEDLMLSLAKMNIDGYQIALNAYRIQHSVQFTDRQRQISRFIGWGLGNKGIARRLKISENTVAHHLTVIYRKLGINSRAALARYVLVFLDPDVRDQEPAGLANA